MTVPVRRGAKTPGRRRSRSQTVPSSESMKILVLNPFGATEPFAEENLRKVARSDVELTVENISPVYPLRHNTLIYYLMKASNATVERIISAEEEGYDAVMISCVSDPGLQEAREVVDIPVAGCFESAAYIAGMMGKRWSVISPDRGALDQVEMLVDRYGLRDKCASFRHIGIHASNLYPEFTPPAELERRTIEQVKKCVEEDSAEVVIAGCSILSAILTRLSKERLDTEFQVPVIDPMVTALKTAEMMVDLNSLAGYPAASRIGLYKKPALQEYREFRAWMKSHSSPEKHYYSEPDE